MNAEKNITILNTSTVSEFENQDNPADSITNTDPKMKRNDRKCTE